MNPKTQLIAAQRTLQLTNLHFSNVNYPST